jgi:hypothetical protein
MAAEARTWQRVDTAILAASLALGVLLACAWQMHDAWDIETSLGLYPTATFAKAEIKRQREVFERNRRENPSPRVEASLWIGRIGDWLPLVLSGVSLGAAVATFRSRARLGRRPLRRTGVITTLLVAVFIVTGCANELVLRGAVKVIVGPYLRSIFMFWTRLGNTIGFAILVTWTGAAVSRTWRCRNDAWDRLGLAIGGLWLVQLAYRQFVSPLL